MRSFRQHVFAPITFAVDGCDSRNGKVVAQRLNTTMYNTNTMSLFKINMINCMGVCVVIIGDRQVCVVQFQADDYIYRSNTIPLMNCDSYSSSP